jgi:superfamily II DNA or RNA helicase
MADNIASRFKLVTWQKRYIDRFLKSNARVSLLVAPVGVGKTVTALTLADALSRSEQIDGAAVLADREIMRDQWTHMANQLDLDLKVVSAFWT